MYVDVNGVRAAIAFFYKIYNIHKCSVLLHEITNLTAQVYSRSHFKHLFRYEKLPGVHNKVLHTVVIYLYIIELWFTM